MSIVRAGRQVLKFFRTARFYRHAGPKGPEEVFFTGVIAGDRPPRYGNIETGRARLPGHRLHRDQEVSPTQRVWESPAPQGGINTETEL